SGRGERGQAEERRVRRDAVHPPGRWNRTGHGGAAGGAGVQAGHLAWRGGEPDRASGRHGRTILSGAGRPAAPVDRYRGRRRPHRRPGRRAGRGHGRARRAGRRPGARPVTDLAGTVAGVPRRSVLPSVIARGAALRVAAVEAGVATLEVTGSPGAVMPLASRIEAQVRAAVPEITAVRIVAPG